ALHPAAARRDDEGLAERMRMPCSPRARLERDARALNKCGIRRVKKRIDPYRASEPLRRPFRGRLRANSFDLHIRAPFVVLPSYSKGLKIRSAKALYGRSSVLIARRSSIAR